MNWCLAGSVTTSSSLTQEVAGLNNIFTIIFVIEFSEFSENIKTQLCYLPVSSHHLCSYLPASEFPTIAFCTNSVKTLKLNYVTFQFLHIIFVLTYLLLNFQQLLFAQMATPFSWHLFHLSLQISFHDGLSCKFALFCNLQTKPSFRMNSNIFSI